MNLEEVRKRWQKSGPVSALQEQHWDAMTESFLEQPVALFAEDKLLQLIDKHSLLSFSTRIFDLGCGVGKYSLAMAQRSAQVTGFDISGNMLDAATDRAERLGLDNVKFIHGDWQNVDLKVAGLERAFDFSLSWLSPALRDYASFEKFCRTSRGYCMIGNHIARSESLSDRFRAVFAKPAAAHAVDDLIWIVAALLLQGKEPQLDYIENSWERTNTFDELYTKYKRRLEASGDVSPADAAQLHDFLQQELKGEAELHERLSSTIGVVYWRV